MDMVDQILYASCLLVFVGLPEVILLSRCYALLGSWTSIGFDLISCPNQSRDDVYPINVKYFHRNDTALAQKLLFKHAKFVLLKSQVT